MALVPLSNLKGDPGLGSHGAKSEPTDLDALRGPSDMGTFAIRLENAINVPEELQSVTANPLLNVLIERNATNSVVQHVTTATGAWYRQAETINAFYPWRRSLDDRDFPVVSADRYATLAEGQSLYVIDPDQGAYDFEGTWPTGAYRVADAGGVWVRNLTHIDGRGVRHSGTGGLSTLVWDFTEGLTDGDALFRIWRAEWLGTTANSVVVRAHADDGQVSAYGFYIYATGGEVRLGMHRLTAGTSGSTIQYSVVDIDHGDQAFIRVNFVGDMLRARAWRSGDPEPDAWMLTVQDSTFTSGSVGFRSNVTSTAFDVLSVYRGNGTAA